MFRIATRFRVLAVLAAAALTLGVFAFGARPAAAQFVGADSGLYVTTQTFVYSAPSLTASIVTTLFPGQVVYVDSQGYVTDANNITCYWYHLQNLGYVPVPVRVGTGVVTNCPVTVFPFVSLATRLIPGYTIYVPGVTPVFRYNPFTFLPGQIIRVPRVPIIYEPFIP